MTHECQSRSTMDIILNPAYRAEEKTWVFNTNASTYSFPVKITETTSSGECYKVDLVARGSFPPGQPANNEEARKLSRQAGILIEESINDFRDIDALTDLLIGTKFKNETNFDHTLEFALLV